MMQSFSKDQNQDPLKSQLEATKIEVSDWYQGVVTPIPTVMTPVTGIKI